MTGGSQGPTDGTGMLGRPNPATHNAAHMNHASTPPHRAAGFTLIEVLIAMVIVGILLAVALPSFMDSIRKGRRSEAFSAMAALQQAQERWRGNNAGYAASTSLLGLASSTAPNGYYAISVTSSSATGYELLADGTLSSQSNDNACAKLGVQVNGGNILYGSCSSCSTFTWVATNTCWSR